MSKVINLDALRRKANPSFVAVKPSKRKFGFDYLPPMTAGLINIAPVRHPLRTAKLLAQAGPLPSSFDWNNPVDVAVKRMKGTAADAKRVAPINTPLNQLACGSCWAFSSSSVLADRYSLFQGLKNFLVLSPSNLLSCSQGSSTFPDEGCNGGFPGSAGQYFEQNGIPTWACQNYDWCPQTADATNDEIPVCAVIDKSCYKEVDDEITPTTPIPKLYKAVKGSTEALATPEDIRAELWHHGPVVAVFVVYADFIGRDRSQTNNPGWQNTSNIYVNLGGEGSGLYSGYSNTDKVGGHAVVITGWGIETNFKGLSDDLTQKIKKKHGGLKYWIVRNSWGTQYNGNGYFKMAESDPELGINMTCGLDRVITVDAGGGQTYNTGGGTTFLPVVSQTQPAIYVNSSETQPKPTPKGSTDPSGGGGTSTGNPATESFWNKPGGYAVYIVSSILLIALIVVIVILVKKHKKKKKLQGRQ